MEKNELRILRMKAKYNRNQKEIEELSSIIASMVKFRQKLMRNNIILMNRIKEEINEKPTEVIYVSDEDE